MEAAATLEGGGPLTSFFLGSSWYFRGSLLSGYCSQRGGKFVALVVVPPKNRVSVQYIVLEASPGPSDLNS
jgi:hypothetical protein